MLLGSALAAALCSFTIPTPPTRVQARLRQSFVTIVRQPKILSFFMVHFLLQLSHAPYYSFFSLYLEGHGYSRGVIGLLWALGVLAEVLAFTQTHRLLARFSEYQLIVCCLTLAAVRWCAIAWAVETPVILWSVQSLHAFTFAVFHAAAMQLIFREFGEGQQGQGQALYSALWGLGVAIGSWLTGMVWAAWGASVIYSIAALVCLLAWLLIRQVWRSPAYLNIL